MAESAETDRNGNKTEADSRLPLPLLRQRPYVSSTTAPSGHSRGFGPAAFVPVPQSLPVPPALPPFHFQVAQKCINSVSDIGKFHSSEAGKTFLGFVAGMNESIAGHKISDPCHESAPLKTLVSTLDHMADWVEEIPPLQQRARYGNPAFRDWQA